MKLTGKQNVHHVDQKFLPFLEMRLFAFFIITQNPLCYQPCFLAMHT